MTTAIRGMTGALALAVALTVACWPAGVLAGEPVDRGAGSEGNYGEVLARGQALAESGRFAEAAGVLDGAATLYPDDYVLHLTRGYYHLRANELPAAETAYRRAMGLSEGGAEARLGLADALEGQGRHSEALSGYLHLLVDRPEDPNLHLRVAWSRFQDGDTGGAELAYQRALDLRPGDGVAYLGLGWCAWREGRRAAARRHFQTVLASDPDNAGAREGLAWTKVLSLVRPRAFAFADLHDGHPWQRFQTGASVGVDLRFDERFRLDLGYQYLYIQGQGGGSGDGQGPGGRSEPTIRAHQHEAHGVLGWEAPDWGVTVHGAYLHYDNTPAVAVGPGEDSGMAGLAGRYRHWAEFRLAATHSWYDDFGVFQGNGAASLPVASFADLVAGFEFQWADARFWPSGSAGVRFHGARWSVTLDGTFGTRYRPVDLASGAVYNTADRISGTASAQVGFALGGGTWMVVGYRFQRRLAPALSGTRAFQEAFAHGLTLGWVVDVHP